MKGIFHFAELRNCLLSIKTTFILCFDNKLIWKLVHLGDGLHLNWLSLLRLVWVMGMGVCGWGQQGFKVPVVKGGSGP